MRSKGSVHPDLAPGAFQGLVDVVFIYPPWAVLDGRVTLQNNLPPLGILSIAAHLESLGYRVAVYDIHGEVIGEEEVRRRLKRDRPKFVGISVLTSMAIPSHKIARICKEELPDCTVVAGGTHAEAMPERMLRNSAIDVVVRGDGEVPMQQIVEGRQYAEIDGLSYRNGSALQHNKPGELLMDLDQYPFPAYHLVDFKNYFPGTIGMPKKAFTICTVPHRCNFSFVKNSFGSL